jgi:hypothetical protein
LPKGGRLAGKYRIPKKIVILGTLEAKGQEHLIFENIRDRDPGIASS